MKIIYRRNLKGLYQKGVFIPFEWIIGILTFLGFIISQSFIIMDVSIELIYKFILPLSFVTLLLFMSLDKLKVSLNKYHYKSINEYSYIKKKIKGKSGDNGKQFYDEIELIGDYEIDVVLDKSNELKSFYENCLKANYEFTANIYKDEVSYGKLMNVQKNLKNKIKILEEISKISIA